MNINYNENDLDLLARIMRAEALSDGDLGMLLVGNVVCNRLLVNCLTFKDINTIEKVINQPNQFSGTKTSLFYGKATSKEKQLAKKILNGQYFHPATNALWFYAPTNKKCKNKFYDQALAGSYKSHCFYNPDFNVCKKLH